MNCRFRTARYVLLPALAMNLLSACGALATNGMAPRQRNVGPNRYPVTQIVTTGEFSGVLEGPRVLARQTEHPQVQWDPSSVQIVASMGIGAAWYIFAVLKPMVDDLGTLGDGIVTAFASPERGRQ